MSTGPARLRPPASRSAGGAEAQASPGRVDLHRMRHHPERLLAGDDAPAQRPVRLHARSPRRCRTTDLLLTMSSTACLEALDHGCRVGLILDLGCTSATAITSSWRAACSARSASSNATRSVSPRPEWLAGYFFDRPASAVEVIADRAEELLAPAASLTGRLGLGVLRQRGRLPPGHAGHEPDWAAPTRTAGGPCIGGSTATGRSAAPSGTRSRRWSRRSSNVRCWPPPDPWPVRWPTTEMLSR